MTEKKSILIVDDDIAHRTMLRILLDWEYKIFEADDGSTAIEKVTSQNFDLVLMDVRMPGVAGVEKTFARKSGLRYLVDMHIEVDREMPVWQAHGVGHDVKNAIRESTPAVQDVLVHIEPHGPDGAPERQ